MTEKDNGQKLRLRRIVLPVVISLGISAYLIAANFKPAALHSLHFSWRFFTGLGLAALALAIRDICFVYKVKLASGGKLSWLKSLQVILLWEFSSAITPKPGEVAVTVYVLNKSGLTYGRSTGVIVLNSFLDNVVFVVTFTIMYAVMGHHILSVQDSCADLAGSGMVNKVLSYVRHLVPLAWIGYGVFCIIALFFGISIFILPAATRDFFSTIGRYKFLKRFQHRFERLGNEIESTANEYRHQTPAFWIKMTIATFVNWAVRFLIVNALVFAVTDPLPDMWDVFARQWVLWIFMVIPATPGAAGWAEISFIALNCEYLPPGLSVAIALIWRIYTYYAYLLGGIIVLPAWLRHTEQKS